MRFTILAGWVFLSAACGSSSTLPAAPPPPFVPPAPPSGIIGPWRAAARQSADWPATRQLVLDRYGPTLGRAILARAERDDAPAAPLALLPH